MIIKKEEDYFGRERAFIELEDSDFGQEEKIGEIISEPHFEDVVFNEKQTVFMKLILNQFKSKRFNLLFSGQAGTGKTYSSKMIACETQKPFIYLNGAMSKRKITNLIKSAKSNAIILIDEIHNLPEKVAEIIYSAIQDNEIYDEGARVLLDNITFIGTTTEPENLPKPLLDRMMRIEFEEPDEETAKRILLKMGLSEECVGLLTNYTLNIRLLKKFIEYTKLYGELNKENLIKVFRLMRINIYSGLSEEQQKYIEYLNSSGKASVRNLSLILRKSENYIKLDIEPDLIRKGIILITSRGRELAPDFKDFSYKELQKESEKEHSEKTIDEVEMAHKFLKDNSKIKEKFGSRYLELVQFIADKISEGISPDELDIESWGNDKGINDSYEDNYKNLKEF